jgi:hypothetical protein
MGGHEVVTLPFHCGKWADRRLPESPHISSFQLSLVLHHIDR